MLGLSLCSSWAEGPDDDYLGIVDLVDQADLLNANGKADSAQAKYVEALKKLVEIKRVNPKYNPSAIAYRIKYVTGKIAMAPAKVAAPETAASGVLVKLIDAGAEPRKALRLHPAAGDKQSSEMTVKMSMEMATGAGTMPIKMPAVQMGMEVTVKSIAAGEIAYEAAITETSVAQDPNVLPQLASGFEAAMTNLKGTTITGVTTDRGVSKNVDVKMSSKADAQARQTMEQLKTAMLQVSLPEEGVGVGAKWSVQQKIKTQGITVDQIETFEITALEDEDVTLKTSLTQTAANQKIENPAMPGAKVDLTKMEMKGAGTATVNLGKLMPTARETEDHTESTMEIGGKKQTVSADVSTAIEAK